MKNTEKEVLFIRIDQRFVKALEAEMEKRGLSSKNEAVRQLISAWLNNPNALPIGLPTTQNV